LFEKIKVFLKNQKHEPNIVEITHLCIMHGAHISYNSTLCPGTPEPSPKSMTNKFQKINVGSHMI
jgi:hypothetical protein